MDKFEEVKKILEEITDGVPQQGLTFWEEELKEKAIQICQLCSPKPDEGSK